LVAAAGAADAARFPRARPDPRLVPKVGKAAGSAAVGATGEGALGVSDEATFGSLDVSWSDMTFMVLVFRAHAVTAAPFLVVSGAQNKIALNADALQDAPPYGFPQSLSAGLRLE
jgi:hypothetical protein